MYKMAKVEDGGMRSQITMDAALNYGTALFSCGRFSQAQTHFHRTIKVCGRAHAAGAQAMLNLKLMRAVALRSTRCSLGRPRASRRHTCLDRRNVEKSDGR